MSDTPKWEAGPEARRVAKNYGVVGVYYAGPVYLPVLVFPEGTHWIAVDLYHDVAAQSASDSKASSSSAIDNLALTTLAYANHPGERDGQPVIHAWNTPKAAPDSYWLLFERKPRVQLASFHLELPDGKLITFQPTLTSFRGQFEQKKAEAP
jgi:hypothetical protein